MCRRPFSQQNIRCTRLGTRRARPQHLGAPPKGAQPKAPDAACGQGEERSGSQIRRCLQSMAQRPELGQSGHSEAHILGQGEKSENFLECLISLDEIDVGTPRKDGKSALPPRFATHWRGGDANAPLLPAASLFLSSRRGNLTTQRGEQTNKEYMTCKSQS